MVGIFSRFSLSGSHRRTQSAIDDREILPPSSDAISSAVLQTTASAVPHGIEVAVEFKPIEHPAEPLDFDQPIQCPLPEPSILNDGRIWKERVSWKREEAPVLEEQRGKIPIRKSNRLIPSSSTSAPEHKILKLLEECNASGINLHT